MDINFPIYFEPRSASVTREADRLIAAARSQALGCQVTGIVVIGLADAPGSPGANLELSSRRARAVAAELHRRGFTEAEFREAAVGAAGASTAASSPTDPCVAGPTSPSTWPLSCTSLDAPDAGS